MTSYIVKENWSSCDVGASHGCVVLVGKRTEVDDEATRHNGGRRSPLKSDGQQPLVPVRVLK